LFKVQRTAARRTTMHVALNTNHREGIDDAYVLGKAVEAYKSYLSGAFTDDWPEASEKYLDDDTQITLVSGELDAPADAVVMVRDYEAGIDDLHYIDCGIAVYETSFSESFADAWAVARQDMLDSKVPIVFVQGRTITNEESKDIALPKVDNDIPDPPKPPQASQLPADDKPPKPTQY
jgi:hypothetical protein